jgi:integrase/recombinase XerD
MTDLPIQTSERALTAAEFHQLAEVSAELEWLANLRSEKTRRAYQNDLRDFSRFVGLEQLDEFRVVTRAHIIAWRQTLAQRQFAEATVRRKLSALSSLFDYLCEKNAVAHNPVKGVKRPLANTNEGKTPALSNEQARRLLEAPPEDTLKGQRDQAMLATLLYQGLRRQELCNLRVKDYQRRTGVMMFHVHGKRNKG